VAEVVAVLDLLRSLLEQPMQKACKPVLSPATSAHSVGMLLVRSHTNPVVTAL
jgi:hypothetical protein